VTEADRNASLRRAADRQQRAFSILATSARLGATTPFDLLDTERVLIQAQNDLAATDALLLDRGVSLFKALGGGWQAGHAGDIPPRLIQAADLPHHPVPRL
jgi:outer membrane protein TolC